MKIKRGILSKYPLGKSLGRLSKRPITDRLFKLLQLSLTQVLLFIVV